MSPNFDTVISSNLDYEDMVIYVKYNQETIAILNRENGVEKMELEIQYNGENYLSLPLEQFIQALEECKNEI